MDNIRRIKKNKSSGNHGNEGQRIESDSLRKPIYLLCLLLTIFFMPPYQKAFSSDLSEIKNLLTSEEKNWLEKHPVLKVGGPKAFPPFAFIDDKNEVNGISHDYLILIMGQLGVRLEFQKSLPWTEVLSKSKAKEIDIISCVARSPEREEYLLFSNPYLSFPLVIIGRKDSPFIGGIEDLKGLKVAMVKQNIVYEWLNRDKIDPIYHFVDSPLDALKAVSTGFAEACIENLASATYLIEKYGLANLKVAAPTAYQDYALFFAVRRDFPELASIINKSLNTLTTEHHTTIRNKWLSVRYEYGISKGNVINWILMVICFALMVIAVIIGCNSSY